MDVAGGKCELTEALRGCPTSGRLFEDGGSARVHHSNGTIRITGRAKSYFEKQMAQERVRRLRPNATIENSLVVVW